ncbi:hypothetical protein ZHAS_00004086 [Anopheles sinensis]|uniref:Uncharacterized protein n=1 Tax=Anopheles sinensis TaxID=74873 RepID=A0A084VG21_ANOSI|nr:hypothetical protein ZHAS_00004086 [Anopheles sinensis]
MHLPGIPPTPEVRAKPSGMIHQQRSLPVTASHFLIHEDSRSHDDCTVRGTTEAVAYVKYSILCAPAAI